MDKGAHFFRCDFQVHTPRDLNWEGAKAETDAERKAYAEELVLACRQKGLNAIAITDHHDFGFFPHIKKAAASECDENGKLVAPGKRLVVFPGIELTLSTPPCQAILILDATFPENLFASLLTALAITPAPPQDEKHAPIQRIPQSVVNNLAHLYEKLDGYSHIKDRFIVLPNVTDSGLGTLLRSGFADFYKTMPCVGAYVDGSVEKLGAGAQQIIQGKNRDYGFKSVGVFQTSDNRHRSHSALGTHSTWVKWSEPTAEALRQACLAKESRLSHTEPQLPNHWLMSLEVSNSGFLGRLDLAFNRQYNAIIGGRGTGKSTILEYLRWGLCDEPADATDWDLVPVQARRKKLVRDTLEALGGDVVVTFALNNVRHVVKRSAKSQTISLRIAQGAFETVTEQEVRNLFPLQAYSQKQLSNVGVRLEELRRFVELPVKQELDQLRAEVRDCQAKLGLAYSNIVRQRQLEAEHATFKVESVSLGEQVAKLRSSLKGLSALDEATIAQKALYDNEDLIIDDLANRFAQIEELVEELRLGFDEYASAGELDLDVHNTVVVKEIRKLYSKTLDRVGDRIGDLEALFEGSSLKPIDEALAKWQKTRVTFDKQYESARSKATSNQQQLAQIPTIEKRIAEINKAQTRIRNSLASLSDPYTQYQSLRKAWIGFHEKKVQLLASQCETFSSLSGGLIRAEINKGLDVDSLKNHLKEAFAGLNIREPKLDALSQHLLTSPAPAKVWESVLSELELLIVRGSDNDSTLPKTSNLTQCGFTDAERARIAARMESQKWLTLSLRELEFNPAFLYQTSKEKNEFIQFSDASAGQQATALLTVLLSQGGSPLIIDQPEDDVDSKMTTDIVQQLWMSKTRRQLVFASHNANFVVNGDAELVVCCDYSKVGDQTGGQLKALGAIDNAVIREEITAVTEGGRAAFKLRKEKYGF